MKRRVILATLLLFAVKTWGQGTERRAFWGKGDFPAPKNARRQPAKPKGPPRIDLRVEVFDARLKPVEGASVSVQKQTVQTDAGGRAALFDALSTLSERTEIKITKSGYFDGFTSVYFPANGSAAVARVQLSALPPPLTFEDSEAQTIMTPSGLRISFPKKAFIEKHTGLPYAGAVRVYLEHRAPENDPLFSFAMPGGDFTAQDVDAEIVALNSYGFFNAELRGENDEALDLAPRKTAEVQFPIPEAMRGKAHAFVPLWSFRENCGMWKYDSRLKKEGNFYKGKVWHFSSWNCDYKGPTCTVIASAKDCNGKPASHVSVCLNQTCAVTDSLGKITFINAPADLPLLLASQEDTLLLGVVGAGKTLTVPQALLAGEKMLARAQFWKDSVEIFTYGEDAPVYYSLDGRKWQTKPLFRDVPFRDSVTVWVKDASDCPISNTTQYVCIKENFPCFAAENESQIEELSTYISELKNWSGPLYGLKAELDSTGSAQLADAVRRFRCLARLTVSGGVTSALPEEILELPALTSLALLNNPNLSVFPSKISKLYGLTKLNLACNRLSALPTEIGALTALVKLRLDFNQLSFLPDEIGKLTVLKELILNNNNLSILPPEIGKCKALTRLDLRNNHLTTLPPEIAKCKALTCLDLRGNPITNLPNEILKLAPNLKYLFLNDSIPPTDVARYQKLLPKTYIFPSFVNGELQTTEALGCSAENNEYEGDYTDDDTPGCGDGY